MKILGRKFEIAGSGGGALAGTITGAKIGSVLGIAGPFGAIAGTIPGAIIGGAIGALTGNRAGLELDRAYSR